MNDYKITTIRCTEYVKEQLDNCEIEGKTNNDKLFVLIKYYEETKPFRKLISNMTDINFKVK